MTDSRDSNAVEMDAEIRRVSSILETVAREYPDGSPESNAIADAAQAYIIVQQHKSLAMAYRRLKDGKNGELINEAIAKLRSVGINPQEFDDADF